MTGPAQTEIRSSSTLADASRGTTDVLQSEAALETVSVVIPALNEAGNIGWVLSRIPDFVDEVILVDGDSVDDTLSVARAARPDVVIVKQPRPGKGAALRAGFNAAKGDLIVMVDADGSMDPTEIGRYVDGLRGDYDLVKGSRFMSGAGSDDITWLRRAGNRALLFLVNLLYGSRFSDLCYGFCSFRRSTLAKIGLTADGFEIETQIVVRALKARVRIGEVPSFESPRRTGESNLRTFRDGLRVLRTLLAELFARPRPEAVILPFQAPSTSETADAPSIQADGVLQGPLAPAAFA